MENDIESTLLTIKNLSKISKNQEIFTNSNTNSSNNSSNINVTNGSNNNGNNNNSNIFDSSLLTKLLKNNILKSCSFDFLGILDDSY
jgi:hypothetical protein